MPIYRHYCQKCLVEYSEYAKIKDRNDSLCPECDSEKTPILISKFSRGHTFKPGFYEHLDTEPVYVKNRQQMKEECKKRGVRALCLE